MYAQVPEMVVTGLGSPMRDPRKHMLKRPHSPEWKKSVRPHLETGEKVQGGGRAWAWGGITRV